MDIKIQPHTHLDHVSPAVLVVGDPKRLDMIGELCDEYKEVAYNREYRSICCKKDGVTFYAVSHGVGSAGAAICFQELIACGAKSIIRVGTCGSLQPDVIKPGDLVICNSAVREDGVSRLLIPQGYPAVCDFGVYSTLINVAKDFNISYHCGITLTNDTFYPSKFLESSLELYCKANVDVVEMEVGTLFVLGKLYGVKTGAILIVDGCPLKWDEKQYFPSDQKVAAAKGEGLKIGIAACVRVTNEFKELAAASQ